MKNRINKFLSVVLTVLFVSGCASTSRSRILETDSVKTVHKLIQKEAVSDARYFEVRKKEFLVFDMESKSRLEEYRTFGDLETKRKFIVKTLTEAKELGDKATELELKRIPAQKMGDAYDHVLVSYKKDASEKLEGEIHQVESIQNPQSLDRYFKTITTHIASSIKTRGRTIRQLLLLPFSPFVRAWMGYHVMTTPHTAPKLNLKQVDVYRPEAVSFPDALEEMTEVNDWQLLQYYAPVIAMEKKEKINFDPKDDQFGKIVIEGKTAAKAQPKVNVAEPVIYAYAETKMVQGASVKFLVYTMWFPERPQLNGGFDPEVGSTQGSIIRIALNKFNEPLVYENVSSCGCYYKIFPTQILEKWAKEKYETPLASKHFVLENKVPKKIDADVPALVEIFRGNSHEIALYSSGTHEVMEIQPKLPENVQANERGSYKLLSYDELESLPFNGGTISMFDRNGLVRNVDRLEAALLAASGIYHAGTPRQRGTLMIYFDQADFDDPQILEKYLRLPEKAFEQKF
ncbi:MAG: hypothetical protein HZC17_05375 [Candidatus Omnitrophica bacterium]|nr:hypothetical protein [Candidatus Omnitrophota bacterium]